MRAWVAIGAAAAALVIAVGGLGLVALQVRVLPVLDGQLLADAGRHGVVINQSVPGTAECWLPLPTLVTAGPLRRCAGIVSASATLHTLETSGARSKEIGLADGSWHPLCPRTSPGCTFAPSIGLRPRLVWVVAVDGTPRVGGYHAVVPDCGPGATLVFVDAHTGSSVLVVSWGQQPNTPPPDFGCG